MPETVASTSKSFDEHLHPRDSEGRFAETPGGGTTPANYRETWRPNMTPEEGHAWVKAAGSKYTATVVHITTAEHVEGIVGTGFHTEPPKGAQGLEEMHEAGAYFATDPETASEYRFKGDEAVSAVVVLQKPLVMTFDTSRYLDAYTQAPEGAGTVGAAFRAAALRAAGSDGASDPVVFRSAQATTAALKAAGYDGLLLSVTDTSPGLPGAQATTVGGNQAITFDKEQAVVIGVTDTSAAAVMRSGDPDATTASLRRSAFEKAGIYAGSNSKQPSGPQPPASSQSEGVGQRTSGSTSVPSSSMPTTLGEPTRGVTDIGKKSFDEHLHPRDSEGRFAETAGGGFSTEGAGRRLKPIEPEDQDPGKVYHVAPASSRDAIATEGLRPDVTARYAGEQPRGVYLWRGYNQAVAYAAGEAGSFGGEFDVWEVPMPDDAHEDTSLGEGTGAGYTTNPITEGRLLGTANEKLDPEPFELLADEEETDWPSSGTKSFDEHLRP